MNYGIKCSLFLLVLLSASQLSNAQSYTHSLKFNYGVFYYNDKDAMSIKEPLSKPFSLGLQYQSNLSKALSNSIGFTAYSWKRDDINYESYSVQDLIFLRNNVRLLNRLKPQIGVGFGVESSTLRSLDDINDNLFFFVPVNVGFQTDLTEHLALGIFGEFKYGFDKDFSSGRVVPNNTAGISLAYRFGRSKKNVYNPIKWDANEAELISLKNLNDYQHQNLNKAATKSPILNEKKSTLSNVNRTDSINIRAKKLTIPDTISQRKVTRMVLPKDSTLVLKPTLTIDSNTVPLKQTDSLKIDSVKTLSDSLLVASKKTSLSSLDSASQKDSVINKNSGKIDSALLAATLLTAGADADTAKTSLAKYSAVPNQQMVIRDTVYLYADSVNPSSGNRATNQRQPTVLINNPNYIQESSLLTPDDSLGINEQAYTQSYQDNSYRIPDYQQQPPTVTSELQYGTYPQATRAYPSQPYPITRYQQVPYQVSPPVNSGSSDGLQFQNVTDAASLGLQLAQLQAQQKQSQLILINQMEMNKLLLSKLFPNSSDSSVARSQTDSLKATIAKLQQQLNAAENSKTTTSSAEAEAAPVVKEPSAKEVSVSATAPQTLCIITYPPNKTNIDDAQRNLILNSVVKEYNKNKDARILIEAYTDSSGPSAYNKKLSDQRLKNISDYLTTLGIPAAHMVKYSYGETNSSPSINNEERRVVFKIKY